MKKKLHDYVKLIDFEREYYDDSKRDDNYGDIATVLFTKPDNIDKGVYKISAGHMDKQDYVAIDLTDKYDNEIGNFTGGVKNKDLTHHYKRLLKFSKNGGRPEIVAALIGYYIYELPKKVRDVKALKLDKETEDTWSGIISEL